MHNRLDSYKFVTFSLLDISVESGDHRSHGYLTPLECGRTAQTINNVNTEQISEEQQQHLTTTKVPVETRPRSHRRYEKVGLI